MTDPSAPLKPAPRRGNRRLEPPQGPEMAAQTGESPPVPTVEWVAAPPSPRRLRHWKAWSLGGAALVVAALVGSWVALPIRTVTVTGNSRLSQARVLELAGLEPVQGPFGKLGHFGWLYYGHWRARGLLDSPWVASAVVTRRFPDAVAVEITERRPVARWQRADGQVLALALDGTVMPGAEGTAGLERLPLIQGWGPERRADALKVLGALGGYNVQSVAYTPTGVTVKLAAGSVWSGDLTSLLKYAGSISMYPNKTIYIYPWGVSVQE